MRCVSVVYSTYIQSVVMVLATQKKPQKAVPAMERSFRQCHAFPHLNRLVWTACQILIFQ